MGNYQIEVFDLNGVTRIKTSLNLGLFMIEVSMNVSELNPYTFKDLSDLSDFIKDAIDTRAFNPGLGPTSPPPGEKDEKG